MCDNQIEREYTVTMLAIAPSFGKEIFYLRHTQHILFMVKDYKDSDKKPADATTCATVFD